MVQVAVVVVRVEGTGSFAFTDATGGAAFGPEGQWPAAAGFEGLSVPEEVTFAGDEIVCQACQALLCTDMSALQRDLIKWKPEMFMARPEAE